MMPKRISIGGLMGFVVVFALAFVALKRADPTWASAWFTFTVLALTVAVFRAAFGPGRSRVFWAGFGLAGWLYLLMAYGVMFRDPTDRVAPPPLLTQYGIDRVREIIRPGGEILVTVTPSPPSPVPLVFPSAPAAAALSPVLPQPLRAIRGGPFLMASAVAHQSFEQIGHSLWALLIAWAGGVFAARLAAKRDRERVEGRVSPSSP